METKTVMARILTCYYKPKPGGFCKRLFMSINALLEHGHDVHYLAVTEFPVQHPRCYFHKFPWPVKYTDNLLFWLFFLLFSPLLLVLLGFRHRISSCYAFNTTYGFLLQPLRILKRIPLSVFLRADVIENHILKNRSFIILSIERVVEGIALFHARVYGVSQTLTNAVVERHRYLRPYKHGVLKNNILHTETTVTNKNDMLSYKPLRLSCAGILETRKNQILLVHVMSQVRHSDVVLYLFGCGPEEEKLRLAVNHLDINNKVKFMGWVDSSIIWQYTDILLMPSLHEGAPNIVLEGLAHNLPVLASNLPEHREVLPASSLLPKHDPSAWVTRITQIIENPERIINDIRSAQVSFVTSLDFDWNTAIVDLITQQDH